MLVQFDDMPGEAPEGQRALWYRGVVRVETVPAAFLDVERSTVALFLGSPNRWTAGVPIHPSPWPPYLPGRLDGGDVAEVDVARQVSIRGSWYLDPHGRPCEIALLRVGKDDRATLISRTGWRLGDLEGRPLPARRFGGVFVVEEGEPTMKAA